MNQALAHSESGVTDAHQSQAHTDDFTPPVVVVEHVFEHDIDTTWGRLGRFGGIAEWQSLVAGCHVEERYNGIYRVVSLHDGTAFTERLESYSHADRCFSYSILSGPLPVTDYVTHLRFSPLGRNRSRLVWRTWYTVPSGGDPVAIAQSLEAMFRNGIVGMSRLLESTR
jgi:hypothetical protein